MNIVKLKGNATDFIAVSVLFHLVNFTLCNNNSGQLQLYTLQFNSVQFLRIIFKIDPIICGVECSSIAFPIVEHQAGIETRTICVIESCHKIID